MVEKKIEQMWFTTYRTTKKAISHLQLERAKELVDSGEVDPSELEIPLLVRWKSIWR